MFARKVLPNYRLVRKFSQVASEQEKNEITTWIQKTFNTDKCQINLSNRTSGYVCDIFFADVNVHGDKHHLAVKIGKTDAEALKLMPIREAGRREMLFYNGILPAFNNLQKNVREPFKAAPKCYKTFLEEDREVIILEDVTKKGFELHKGSVPYNRNHLKLGLKNYAKFHALSFALRDQSSDVFEKLTTNSEHIYRSTVHVMRDIYATNIEKVVKQLTDAGSQDLSKKYEKFMERGAGKLFTEIFDSKPRESVVTHSNCHNSNYFFKYQETKENPSEMMIIDYQNSCLHSPVLDVSYFWYTGASKEVLPHFPDLIAYYHQEMSSYLQELGSNADKIFPLSRLWDHWEKYSRFGFMMSSLYMDVLLFDHERNALGKQNTAEKKMLEEAYINKLKTIMHHYFTFT